jgi:hypothetical protein
MTHDEIITVVQAHKDGEQLQIRLTRKKNNDFIWSDLRGNIWDFEQFEYRIKPKPRERWFGQYPNGQLTVCAYQTKQEVENFGPEYKPICFKEDIT